VTDLENYRPWAVVAGGSEGVGAEFAKQLAAAGRNLVLRARRPDPLEATADDCRTHGVDVRTLAVDLVVAGSIDRLLDETADLEVGLLIYNAGAAMERVGLNFEVPGMRVAEPADVAREGLEQLPNGPVCIAGGNGDDVERRNDPDRAKVVLGTHRFMQKLIGGNRS
jgi:NAD(P)-dependent dehydrogenase (short-subunit alcohol dehydrogenase family)